MAIAISRLAATRHKMRQNIPFFLTLGKKMVLLQPVNNRRPLIATLINVLLTPKDKNINYMKKQAILIMLLLLSTCLTAQTTLSGTVRDQSSNSPLPFATVAVMKADSSVVTGGVTDESGAYRFVIPARGHYLLAVSFIGFQTHYQPLLADKAQLELPAIALVPDATTLQAVQVVERAPIVEQQMDKLVMNVSQSAFAQGSNALDLLRKAPGVSIDKDGNVLLNGQPVAVWIDGRPSHLDGKSLETLLRGTDGSGIDRIEVIANPSAKYDAQGQGGIINIRTKHHFAQGLNGSVSANLGGMAFNRDQEGRGERSQFFLDHNISANISLRTEKTNTFLQLSEQSNQIGVDLTTTTDARLGDIQLKQYSSSLCNVNSQSLTFKIGNDWFIDSRNTLGVIFTMPFNSVRQWDDSSFSYQMVNNQPVQQILTNPITEYSISQYIANLNYTHIFDPARAAELTANIDYFHNITSADNIQNNYHLPILSPMVWLGQHYDSAKYLTLHNDNTIDIYSAKVDYQSVVMGSFMMEAGAKWALSHTDNLLNQITGTQYRGNDTVYGSSVDNPFGYTEHVGALYATLARQFNQCWTVKAGLRGEYTYAFSTDRPDGKGYFNLFPTLYAGYNTPDMMKRLGLSYTRRITRPNYNQLNPFKNYVDAHTSNMGNPDLQPSFSDNVALTAGFGRYLTLSGNFIYTKDQLTIIPTLDPATGDQVMHYDNFGSTTLLGGGVALTELPLGKFISFTLNANAYDYHSREPQSINRIIGQEGEPSVYDRHSFLGTAYACFTFNLPQNWKVQLDGYYSSPIIVGYLHTSPNEMVNLGVKKTAMEGRLLLSLQVNDLLRTMSNSFEVEYADGVKSAYEQNYLFQKISFGLQWNFGTAQKPLKHRNVGKLDELERASNTSGQLN